MIRILFDIMMYVVMKGSTNCSTYARHSNIYTRALAHWDWYCTVPAYVCVPAAVLDSTRAYVCVPAAAVAAMHVQSLNPVLPAYISIQASRMQNFVV